MKIPFTKAHGAHNDFLLTWRSEAPEPAAADYPAIARAICDRHTGIGADGWMLVDRFTDGDVQGAIQLYNSDGSQAEISGNGTRCAAAFLVTVHQGDLPNPLRIRTGAGIKTLRLLDHNGFTFEFEMNMGRAEIQEDRCTLPLAGGPRDAAILWVGNPQCAVPVENFDFDWRAAGAEIERHPRFPNRINVSFVKSVDQHTIDVRFWERGAGETMSSGTGSTGAAAMAVARGMVQPPVRVLTPAGPIDLRFEDEIFLTGPAQIVALGIFLAPDV